MTHEGGSVHRSGIVKCRFAVSVGRQFKHHDIRFVIAHKVKTMLIGSLEKIVVSVDKLDEFSLCRPNACVTGLRHSLVLLSDIHDVLPQFEQFVDGRDV